MPQSNARRSQAAIWPRLGRIVVGIVVGMSFAPLQAEDGPEFAQARVAADYLDKQWGTAKGWKGIEPWQRFVAVDALIDYDRRTGDKRWRTNIAAAVRNHSGIYGNDDDLWAVIASVHAWRLDGDPALLAYAASTYERLVTSQWDDHCSGGLWWNPTRGYKNAITNEELIYASTQLYLATGQVTYRDWALRAWSWFEKSSMIADDGLVNDGLDANCHNNHQPRFTYNQGVLIGALNDLTTITGNPEYRAIAVKTAIAAVRGLSTPQGILREPVEPIGSDGMMFKGIFAYHLGHLLDDLPEGTERSELKVWANLNAEAVWRASGSGTRAIGADWSSDSSPIGPAAQASGIDMLLAARR